MAFSNNIAFTASSRLLTTFPRLPFPTLPLTLTNHPFSLPLFHSTLVSSLHDLLPYSWIQYLASPFIFCIAISDVNVSSTVGSRA